ncbi:MAG TPA: alpha/beta hydrolase [Ktedonobacteraceae bacterium]|nr:alpha/beta hydrolase [Ktedonobacteraceae bacterium]
MTHKQAASPLQLAYGEEEFQFGELYLPDETGPYPVSILIHGGYWRARYGLDLMNGLAEDLATRGIAAWNIEYRRVGNSGGGWPGTFEDVARATDCLARIAEDYELDVNRVVPIGHSAGGHLAMWLASRPRIPLQSPLAPHEKPLKLRGAISLAGVLDLTLAYQLHLSNDAVVGLLGGTPDEVPERYQSASPIALLPLGLPQILIHGTADESVPFEMSQQYAGAARLAGDAIHYIELDAVDHFDVINAGTEVWKLTVEQLLSLFA